MHLLKGFPGIFAIMKSSVSYLIVSVFLSLAFAPLTPVQARVVHMYEGDSIELPDDWEFSRGRPNPQAQPGTLFTAVSKDGCGIRIDSTGIAQNKDSFNTDVRAFDKYIEQLLVQSQVDVVSDEDAKLVKIADFKAIEKNYVFTLKGALHKAQVVQFNTNHHLYNAGILAISEKDDEGCLKLGAKILSTVKSK